jgi:hypothetical protein
MRWTANWVAEVQFQGNALEFFSPLPQLPSYSTPFISEFKNVWVFDPNTPYVISFEWLHESIAFAVLLLIVYSQKYTAIKGNENNVTLEAASFQRTVLHFFQGLYSINYLVIQSY